MARRSDSGRRHSTLNILHIVATIWNEDRLDEPKRLVNIARHEMDFADLDYAFFENATIRRSDSGRSLAIGYNAGRLVAIVFTLLGREAVSLVSMRPASRKERKLIDG